MKEGESVVRKIYDVIDQFNLRIDEIANELRSESEIDDIYRQVRFEHPELAIYIKNRMLKTKRNDYNQSFQLCEYCNNPIDKTHKYCMYCGRATKK